MKNTIDIIDLIAGFYAVTYDNRTLDLDYRAEFVGLFRHLHEQAFPEYKFDPKDLLAQAERQLRGNARAVELYTDVSFQFEPIMSGDKLVIYIGCTSQTGHPNGTLGIWTDDKTINSKIQRALEVKKMEDTIA